MYESFIENKIQKNSENFTTDGQLDFIENFVISPCMSHLLRIKFKKIQKIYTLVSLIASPFESSTCQPVKS